MRACDFFASPIGTIVIEASDEAILALYLAEMPKEVRPNLLTKRAKEWLESYFAAAPLPLPPLAKASSDFAQKVREATLEIPFGKCATYGQIAERIGSPKAYRAVAQALKHNPFMIMVPCHRVIAKKGLGGYNGGIEIKKRLLEFEGCGSINL